MVKRAPKTLADLKPAPYNPRQMAGEALEGLKVSVSQFGDISGIVYNTRTGHLVCGHQRLEALKQSAKVRYDPKAGAVVAEDGRQFPVRLVDWDEATEKAANVAANSPHIAGEWTEGLGPLLAEVEAGLPELHNGLRLGELADSDSPSEPLKFEVEKPPAVVWYLLRVPLAEAGKAQEAVEALGAIEGVVIDSTVR